MHVDFFPSYKRKASSHLAQLVCACISKRITCWGCFTSDLNTEIAGRSLKDFTSGRSLNQTLWVGWWNNSSSAAPAVPDSTSAVLGLAYRRIEQRSQHLQRLPVWRTDVDFKALESAQLWYHAFPSFLSPLWFVCLFVFPSNPETAEDMPQKCLRNVCVFVYFTVKAHYNRKCHWKIDLRLEIIHRVIHSLIVTYCICRTRSLRSLVLVKFSWKSDRLSLIVALLHLEK